MEENNTENRYKPESNDFKPKTEDELAKERKNRKWELISGAIGDMGSAFANLFFTTKGAPSTISTAGKNRQATLMDRIKSRYKEEDEAYGKRLSAWEKEQEKLRKEADRLAKENDVIEGIHDNYRPKTKNWDNDAYIEYVFDRFHKSIEKKTTKYNNTGEDEYYQDGLSPAASTFAGTVKAGQGYPNKSQAMQFINSFDLKSRGKKYMKQEIMREILSGSDDYGLDDDYLDALRKELMEMDEEFVK